MARARGPVGHTCPIIDDCIRYIERAIVDPDEVPCLGDLIGGNGILEDIRSANSQLRDWGAEQEDKVIALEDHVSDLEATISDKESRIKELEEQLEAMEAT